MSVDQQNSGVRHLVDEIQDQFLICQICKKPYHRPKNLSCLHTFCLKCIETTYDNEMSSRKYGDPREVSCPLCLKKTQLPVGGTRNLNDNFLVMSLAELVEKQKSLPDEKPLLFCDICKEEYPAVVKQKSEPAQLNKKRKSFMGADMMLVTYKSYSGSEKSQEDECNGEADVDNGEQNFNHINGERASEDSKRNSVDGQLDDRQRIAVSKCLECNKLLCKKCIKKHQDMKVTSRHSMIDVETEKDVECKDHPGEPVRFFCNPCQTCVCVLCAFNTHREHDVEHFSDAASKQRDPLQALISVCEEKVAEFNNTFHGLTSLEKNLREVEDRIREMSSELVMKIRQQERQLLESLRSEIDPRIFDYIDNKKDLTLQMETLQSTCSLAKIVVESNDVEMLLLKKEVEEKLITLSLVGLKELPEGVLKEELTFVPGQADLGSVVRSPGTVEER